MEQLKNLANCTPREFIKQTAKIRRSVQKWLTLTDIVNIRKRLPDFPKDATPDEKSKMIQEQSVKNINAVMDAILEEYPDETIDVIALCCFLEPEDVDNYSTADLLTAMNDMIGNEAVLGFFTSLVKLARTNILSL